VAAEGTALFKAIADFSRYRREAKAAAGATREWKRETRALNTELAGTEKATGRVTTKLNRLGQTLAKVQGQFERIRTSGLGQMFDKVSDSAERLAPALSSAQQAAGGLDKVAAKAKAAATSTKEVKEETSKSNAELAGTERVATGASSKLDRLGQTLSKLAGHLDRVKSSRVGQELDKMAAPAGKLFATLGKIGTGVAGLSLIGTMSAGSVGGVLSLVGAVISLTGALGALPALAGAGLAAVGTIAVGLIGIADAFKETGSAAGGMEKAQRAADRAAIQGAEQVRSARQRVTDAYANGARRIADAERAVARAQRDAEDAQKDLTNARADAVEQLEDLGLALRGGQLDEKSATLRLKRAQQELQKVIASGVGGLDLEEAVLGVEEAELALDQAKERYGDLREESEKATKAGVDGAENVVAAQRRVDDAVEGTADAQQALTDARTESAREIADAERDLAMAIQAAAWAQEDAADSMASAAGKAGPALSKSAQEFVDAVKGLQGRFDSLRLNVQEKLFDGLGSRVTQLADQYFPMLDRSMGNVATTFNGMAHDFADWA
jgi:predicted  nucleic acid-binding Zn-ribbon protein